MKPGKDIIVQGLKNLSDQKETIYSLLVSIGEQRLRSIGIPVPEFTFSTPEHRLYAMLSKEDSDSAHSKYNAWIRRLVSFERAAERESNSSAY